MCQIKIKKYQNIIYSKKLRFLLLVVFIIASSLLSLHLSFSYIERSFFDRIFYKKSSIHGYGSKSWNYRSRHNFLIDRRLKDLKILGQQDSQKIKFKHQDKFTVAVIGDSMAYGLGVKQAEAFPYLLENKLNEVIPTKVYNFSSPGDGALSNYVKYYLAKKYLDIDLFLFGIWGNDLLFKHGVYPNQDEFYSKLSQGCDGKELSIDYDKVSTHEEVMRYGEIPSFDDRYKNICILDNSLKKINMDKSLFFTYDSYPYFGESPESLDLWGKYNYIMHRYKKVIRNNNGKFIDLFRNKNFEYITVSKKEKHPGKKTHEFYAQQLFEFLKEEYSLN